MEFDGLVGILVCRTAITKYHSMVELNNKVIFSHSEARSLRSTCWQGLSFLKPFYLAWKWLSSPYVSMWFSLCMCLCYNLFLYEHHLSCIRATYMT